MKLLRFTALTFVFLVVVTLNFPKNDTSLPPVLGVEEKNYNLVPVLTKGAAFPQISAQSVYAIDLTSDSILYEKMADEPQLPASTAKIITALVAFDYYPEDMVLEVGKVFVEGQKMGLVEGEKMTVENLLYGLLIYSANDAAEVLAQNYPAGRELFISAMNLKANELGLTNTFFENPTGLDGIVQMTSAKDLARCAEYAIQNPRIAEIVATKEKEVASIDGVYKHKLVNLNILIGEVDGVLGVKTGWTENARENLVTYIKRGKREMIISLLDSEDRFGETKEIIEWLFANYEWKEISYP